MGHMKMFRMRRFPRLKWEYCCRNPKTLSTKGPEMKNHFPQDSPALLQVMGRNREYVEIEMKHWIPPVSSLCGCSEHKRVKERPKSLWKIKTLPQNDLEPRWLCQACRDTKSSWNSQWGSNIIQQLKCQPKSWQWTPLLLSNFLLVFD